MLTGLYIRPSLKTIKGRTLLLNRDRQLLAVIESMHFRLLVSLSDKIVFFGRVVVNSTNRVEVITFPVSSCSLSFHDFIVSGDL